MAKMLLSQLFFFFFWLSHYFIFSSGMLNNILSQMCGRLYFPIFLLSVGLFTLMYIDSDSSGQAVVFPSNYFSHTSGTKYYSASQNWKWNNGSTKKKKKKKKVGSTTSWPQIMHYNICANKILHKICIITSVPYIMHNNVCAIRNCT